MKIILLTGFLGSGKTTLLQRLLEEYRSHKMGFIINDFGKINVDARLIEHEGMAMAELSNGSIFCACIKDKFIYALEDMTRNNLEYIFIEASGLADPSNMRTIVDGINIRNKSDVELAGSICIIDGDTFLDTVEMLPAIERQVRYSNAVVVNKLDLIDNDSLVRILSTIKSINLASEIYTASYCNVDLIDVVDNFRDCCVEAADSTNTYDRRPTTVIMSSKEKVSLDALNTLLDEVSRNSYRIKGFVDTDHGMLQVNCVGSHIEMEPWYGNDKSELVVISSVGIRIISILTETMKKLELNNMEINI